MRKIIGYGMLITAFSVIVGLMCYRLGYEKVLLFIGLTAVLSFLFIKGVMLLNED